MVIALCLLVILGQQSDSAKLYPPSGNRKISKAAGNFTQGSAGISIGPGQKQKTETTLA